ncbi:MAG: thermonuclease family protein [Nitrospirae bacterium]|nr:thermonuclease family protein [Nitrospirota bacterium]
MLSAPAACGPEHLTRECGPETAVVSEVVDGDTVRLDTGESVRYLLADTPETTPGKEECLGSEAGTYNRQLVEGRAIRLEYDQECRDRYGRLLAYVSIEDRSVNALLVERGYACVLHIPPNGNDRVADYQSLENSARTSHRGLWGLCPEPPCGD